MQRGATFDGTGVYRYHLWREWDQGLPVVTFVMLNPSTADAEQDDPTIRRCTAFARNWGYGRLEVVNLFAYRAASPRELFAARDPVGPENRRWVSGSVEGNRVVVAWGNHGRGLRSPVWEGLSGRGRACLGLTALGEPRHPLYVPGDRLPQLWRPQGLRLPRQPADVTGNRAPILVNAVLADDAALA
ncbi:MAG: DUF1643 domain-containing protein [Anaerolineales bacterium]